MEGTFWSLIPPLVAILLCVWLKDAIPSLFVGVFVGAMILHSFDPVTSLFRSFDTMILNSFTDTDHAINLMFVVLIGGLVGIMNESPVTRAWIERFASSLKKRAHAGVSIWCAGIVMFIDDYANTLIVGNGFRKFADRLKISREKLAFLVDTTAAPITSLALVSTWIGFEISVINQNLTGPFADEFSGYGLFFASLPYRFYPVLMLMFALMLAWSGRDYGPMYRVERRAARKPLAEEPFDPDYPEQDYDASLTKPVTLLVFSPFLLLTILCIVFLIISGVSGINADNPGFWDTSPSMWDMTLEIFTAASAFQSILWATLLASVASFVVHLMLLRETYSHTMDSWMDGCRSMFSICMILTLAWSIGSVCKELDTGGYVATLLGEDFNPTLLPLYTFLFAAVISFATGTSYGTMSILFPICLPLALQFVGADGTLSDQDYTIIYGTTGSVLGGAIFGDHCSPISDTTILSAGASGCSVTGHVNTQLPYALTVALFACISLVVIQYTSSLLLIAGSLLLLFGIIYLIGRRPDLEPATAGPAPQAMEPTQPADEPPAPRDEP